MYRCLNVLIYTVVLFSFLPYCQDINIYAFTLSGESSSADDCYEYRFSPHCPYPDYAVVVTATASDPDITMRIVDNPQEAQLILIDDLRDCDMRVCKSRSFSYLTKIIAISKYVPFPDITILLSEHIASPDYTIYVSSKTFTVEQAASLFAVIWENNRNN